MVREEGKPSERLRAQKNNGICQRGHNLSSTGVIEDRCLRPSERASDMVAFSVFNRPTQAIYVCASGCTS